MRLGHIELFVTDLEASRDFYRDAMGCTVTVESAGRFVWLKSGESELLLRKSDQPSPSSERYGGAGPATVFYTEDLPGTLVRLESMGVIPRGYDGGDSCPIFQDPDGHWIQVVDPASQ
jgi:catechol 2,3-dioxygenase-like lactoylglutathione lyase family enzyme